MIAEKLPISFDIKRIRSYFNTHVKHLEPVCQNEMFGGGSILSASGDYRDGFQQGFNYYKYNQASGEHEFDYEKAHSEIGFNWPCQHVNPTEVGTEYILEVIETLRGIGLRPHRARWTRIMPQGTTTWHQDADEDSYAVRLHIPVITNPACAFVTEEGEFHMPADGSCFLVNVNCFHKAYNQGNEARIHIIMDVLDDVGISQYHRTPTGNQANLYFNKWNLIRIIKKIFGR